MKKLRLTEAEEQSLLKNFYSKFRDICNRNISILNYTQTDVDNFLKEINKNKKITKPIIQITAEAYVTMYELVRQSNVEIQWHGLVKKEENIYKIYDILVFPQTNSATSTSSDQNEFAKWQTDLIMDANFPIEEMRMHGHSHVNMNVYSSSIDDGYQSELITKVDDGDFYIFLVLNKKMEMYPLLYDFDQQILFEGKDIQIEITAYDNAINIRKWCSEQIQKYCTTSKPASIYNGIPKTNFKIDQYIPEQYIVDLKDAPKKFPNRR